MTRERVILLLALAAGVLLRVPALGVRPMHTDEAVHAIKFGELLEHGTYRYDSHEYHGPTLNYLSLIPARLASARTLDRVTEATLRTVPVFFGIVLIILPVFIARGDSLSIAIAALLTACSPAMVFYSRYYIQEMLLVAFAFACIVSVHRYALTRNPGWSAAAGLSAGLMCATKETWIILAALMGIAGFLVLLVRHREGRPFPSLPGAHVYVAALCFFAVTVLFYSSFFTHWRGVTDAAGAYAAYFTRAGESSRHGHPFWYYLGILAFSQGDHGPLWTEIAILTAGLAGIVAALRRKTDAGRGDRDFVLFMALYALLVFVVLSALPYKTPWLMLGALQPLIVCAGAACAGLLRRLKGRRLAPAGVLVTALVVLHLGWQAYMGSFVYADDPVNPYVYSQPRDDVRQIAERVTRAAAGEGVPVQVVCSGSDYWPLPWYLRLLPRVGWWSGVDSAFVPAPVILVSPDLESALVARIYDVPPPGKRDLYVPLFDRPMFIRPGKEIRGYIRLDLRAESGSIAPRAAYAGGLIPRDGAYD